MTVWSPLHAVQPGADPPGHLFPGVGNTRSLCQGPKLLLSLYMIKSSGSVKICFLEADTPITSCLPSTSCQAFHILKIRKIFPGTWTSQRRKTLKVWPAEDSCPCSSQWTGLLTRLSPMGPWSSLSLPSQLRAWG